MRVDDGLVLLLFLGVLPNLRNYRVNKKLFFYIFLFVFFTIYGLGVRNNHLVKSYDNYPLVRILGIIIYYFCLSLSLRSTFAYQSFLSGVYRGAIFLSVVVLLALLFHLLSVGAISGLYSLKDSLRMLGTFNPNTYGALFLFASFCSYALYKIKKESKFKIFSAWFLFLPFLFLIKRDMLGVLVGMVYLYVVSRNNILYKRFLIVFIGLVSVYIIDLLIELWYSPQFMLLMAHRVEIYGAAVEAIMKRIQGNGIGSEIEMLTYYVGRPNVSHNSFLSMCIELGIFNGTVFFLSLLVLLKLIKVRFIRFYLIAFFVESLLGNGFYFYKYHFLFLLLAILYYSFYKNNLIIEKI